MVLSVVHFNHRLRGAESDGDQQFVGSLAGEFDLEFFVDGEDVAQRAAEEHISVETAARELRYGFFRHLLGSEDGVGPSGDEASVHEGSENHSAESAALPKSQASKNQSYNRGPEGPLFHGAGLDKIVTGHTLDDQAETVLMRIIRGAGLRGLGGIHPRILVEDDDGEVSGEIIRPLLGIRRRELERYLKDIGQAWREDSTNSDARFTRNRVRKLVVPLAGEGVQSRRGGESRRSWRRLPAAKKTTGRTKSRDGWERQCSGRSRSGRAYPRVGPTGSDRRVRSSPTGVKS